MKRKATPRRKITRSSFELRTFWGKNDKKAQYLFIKGHLRKSDYFNVFLAHELKLACFDILGLKDSKEARRRHNANRLAKQVWEGPPRRFPRLK